MERKSPVLNRRMSAVDAAFLYLERKEIPLNIGCVCMFDEPVPFQEFVANMDSKLHLIPRYRQVVKAPPFNIGYPIWEQDPGFDIHRHVLRIAVDPPGGQPELEQLAGRILSQMMDRSKPLWEIYVVEGLKDGRGALIVRVHHALADGVAGAALMRVMLDPTPEGSHAIRKPRFEPEAPPPDGSLVDQLTSAVQSSMQNLIAAEAGLLDFAQGLLTDRMQDGLQRLVSLLPELAAPVDRFCFNKPCTGDRKFCWTEFSFADAQAIRATLGGTLNDVLLAVLTRAVARYVKLHGEKTDQRLLRVVCPVNVRNGDGGESLGNRITFFPVVLPIHSRGPVETLHAVIARTEIMKSVRAAEVVAIAGSWLGATPPPLQALFWWGVPLMPLAAPLFNVICTNVPGPPAALYTVGRRMTASYPHVPTGYELGFNCAIQSYDGRLFFGLTADSHVVPDAPRLRDFVADAFAELAKAAGVKKKRQPRRARKEPIASAAAV